VAEGRRRAGDGPEVGRRAEAAAPAPFINLDGPAGAYADRAYLHIALKDVPCLIMRFRCAAILNSISRLLDITNSPSRTRVRLKEIRIDRPM
jgi:hypothetical protein